MNKSSFEVICSLFFALFLILLLSTSIYAIESPIKCFSDDDCSSLNNVNSNQFCEFSLCPDIPTFAPQEGTCIEIPELFPTLYEPVCGCDGKTYPNNWARQAAKVSKDYNGTCIDLDNAPETKPLSIYSVQSTGLSADIAYVVKDAGNPDSVFISVLNDLNASEGISYKLIDDSLVSSTNFSQYKLILLGNENINDVPVNSYKSVIVDPDYYIGWSASIGSTTSTQPLRANNTNTQSPISRNLLGEFQVYTQAKDGTRFISMRYLSSRKYSVTRITSTMNSLGDYAIATKDAPRRVFFGITESEFWTPESRQLFENSILWVLKGEDKDNDTFFTDNDCNDNNASINPDADETPYNRIDENCDGFDLADVDNDGYCLLNYSIMNKTLQCSAENLTTTKGTDCNDNEEGINPNATELVDDIDQNCRNDAPVFNGTLANYTWNEDENLEDAFDLNNYFYDFENDELNFSIYNTTSDKNITVLFDIVDKGVVSFTSNENWFGNDWVVFKASDGKGAFNITNKIFLTVESVNDAPVLQIIHDIFADEGDLISIRARATDVDKDVLEYNINDIKFTNNGDGNFTWRTNYSDEGIYNIIINVTDGNLSDSQEFTLNIDDANQRPVVQNIENKIINEDTNLSFVINASDPDQDALSYTIVNENEEEVDCQVDYFGEMKLIPAPNWNGEASCKIEVSDGIDDVRKEFNITVTPINDAPIIHENGRQISILAGELFRADIEITDVEGDEIIINFNAPLNSIGEWQTSLNDSGIYNITFNASDNLGATSEGLIILKVVPKIVINEIEADVPGADDSLEWVELYNPNDFGVDISGWKIYDTQGSSAGLRYAAPSSSNIPAYGFYIVSGLSDLNNANESLILKDSLGYIIDETPVLFDESQDVQTWQRMPNGFDSNSESDWIFQKNTKGMTNEADIIDPVVTLIYPEDEELFEISNLTFNFSVSDNNAENLTCSFYSNIEGVFEELETGIVANGTENYFWANDIEDGEYIWNVLCSDGLNNAFASSNFSFTVDEPDAPLFGAISDITLEENETLELDLTNYTHDADDDPLKHYTNAAFGSLDEDEGVFIWTPDFDAEENSPYNIEFTVTDGTFNVSRNATIIVNRFNRKPVLAVIEDQDIDEEELDELTIVATDEDMDNLTFSVSQEDENEVDCEVENIDETSATLSFEGAHNFFGEASCSVKVSDGFGGEDIKTFYVAVSNTPDSPVIDSSNPNANPRLINDTDQLFVIHASDPDLDLLSIVWFLQGMSVSDQWNYIFNQAQGNYNLTAVVSDGMFNISKEWNIFVGNIEEFTCSEVNGFLCNSNQICYGEEWDTKDSSNQSICCSNQCSLKTPDFEDADTCEREKRNNSLIIDIEKPDKNDDFSIKNEEIKVKINLENKFSEDIKTKLKIYLYDLTDDEVIGEEKDSASIDENDEEEMEFVFNISEYSEDIDTSNDFAIFIYAEADLKDSDVIECNQGYVAISIERKDYDLSLEDINVAPENAICGDTIDIEAKLKNIGTEENDVYLSVENKELGIKEKTSKFELDSFDESDDEATKSLSFKIPDNAAAGTYTLNIIANHEDGKVEFKRDIVVGECIKQEVIEEEELEEIVSGEQKRAQFAKLSVMQQYGLLIFLLIAGIIMALIAIAVVVRRR